MSCGCQLNLTLIHFHEMVLDIKTW